MLPRLLLVASVLAATACGHARSTSLPAPVAAAPAVASTLGAGDVLEVRVFQEPELSGVYQVGPQGDVMFPLCKQVVVDGLTANGAAEKLRACLANGFLRDPQVSVLVKEYNSKKVFVFGEVQKPGTFPYQDGMSIVQAVTIAGGFTKTAAQNSTSVTRRVNGTESKVKVNVQDIALGKAPNFTLEPGDIVYVPESLF
ncbi:polysaccharide biosynthesis/export family protein [Anaeromyxobacter oryzae]|uniref:Sugar ABC transporter substrate-binding protein n=1 Tax=Anaeromyxobacter oryzae TaxID=2918170 RepID=A0ABM7WSU1_9BACT|nr:polysaccharide biosynthesis/export family protein [Anaeromyxobacter oryzae]BDG02532.1 sugar ABC transporter substrate-binding protein [Anaeromyxobacter oryzae]